MGEKWYVWRANYARNWLKHLDGGEDAAEKFDVSEEASDMIKRAIDNYWMLNLSLTSTMDAFTASERSQ